MQNKEDGGKRFTMMVQTPSTSTSTSTYPEIGRRPNRTSTRRRMHRVRPSLSLESIPEDFTKECFADEQSLHDTPLKLVNQERARRNLPPFRPSSELQQLADQHCYHMAQQSSVFHSVQSIDQLVALLRAPHAAESIQRGSSLLEMHYETVSQRRSVNYCNLVSNVFTEFGAACYMGRDGKLYQCQLFRK